jgi:nucleoside-diphosphate-sugar epimerase
VAASAFVLGGTGQIGTEVAKLLARSGWKVTTCDRGSRAPSPELAGLGVQRRVGDRQVAGDLEGALGSGADVLIDTVAFDSRDARQLAGLASVVGSVVAISSASVYCDIRGRTLDEATREEEFPVLPVPVSEDHTAVAPGAGTYSTRKVAMENSLLACDLPATLIRAGAVHGPFSRHAREWFFLKRALDGRTHVLIDYGGASRFHTVSVENIAELVRLAAERPANRILNCGDPDPPTTLEVAHAAWTHVGRRPPVEVLLEGAADPEECGGTPWSIPHPFLVDTRAAKKELGYEPATTYADSVSATFTWLEREVAPGDWRDLLPQLAAYPWNLFDYEAEDRWLAARAAQRS